MNVDVPPLDSRAMEAMRAELDRKTKPRGSLGRLEELAVQLAGIGVADPRFAVLVAAADHGYSEERVSAYPREVTGQMLRVFASGGAAICVLARSVGAELVVVDAGVLDAPTIDGVRSEIVDGVRGTEDFTFGRAMSRPTAIGAIERGIALADGLADDGIGIVGIGEMGIGNTTSASALAAALLIVEPVRVSGSGAGLDDAGIARKVDAVHRGLAANGLPRRDADPLDVLAAVGGLEVAFLVGVCLGAACRRVAIVLDGFITGAAALVASRMQPLATGSMIAATRSPEPGHALVLDSLGLEPLLDLRLRLGEGTGAALALPLVRSAVAIVTEMATFESAGVSGPAETDAALVADA